MEEQVKGLFHQKLNFIAPLVQLRENYGWFYMPEIQLLIISLKPIVIFYTLLAIFETAFFRSSLMKSKHLTIKIGRLR